MWTSMNESKPQTCVCQNQSVNWGFLVEEKQTVTVIMQMRAHDCSNLKNKWFYSPFGFGRGKKDKNSLLRALHCPQHHLLVTWPNGDLAADTVGVCVTTNSSFRTRMLQGITHILGMQLQRKRHKTGKCNGIKAEHLGLWIMRMHMC